MLAAPRSTTRIPVDPQNTAWANNTTSFGYRMLQKMGWQKGQGLGTQLDGNTKHISQPVKLERTGIGARKDTSLNWMQGQDAFAKILKGLNEIHGGNEKEIEMEEEKNKEDESESESKSKSNRRKEEETTETVTEKKRKKKSKAKVDTDKQQRPQSRKIKPAKNDATSITMVSKQQRKAEKEARKVQRAALRLIKQQKIEAKERKRSLKITQEQVSVEVMA